MHFPLGVFAVAVGTATLPKVSEEAARDKIGQLVKTFDEAFGLTMFLVVPSAVYLAGFGEDLVRLIYERGAFDSADSVQTAQALFFYSFGLVGFAGVRVTAPVFYALGDSRRPMTYSIMAVAINVGLNFALIPFWGFAGLAAATSIAGLANMILLTINIRKKVSTISYMSLLIRFFKMIVAAIASYFVAVAVSGIGIINIDGIIGKVILVIVQIASLGIGYIVLCWVLRIDDIKRLKLHVRLKK
jgi:putative peptidoglycan lipid II flippase